MQQTALSAGIGVDAQCGRILPRDMQPSRPLRQTHGAVRLALLAFGFVLRGVPRVGNLTGFVIERQVEDVALLRADAEAPFIDNL
jgi:hypothetical protein